MAATTVNDLISAALKDCGAFGRGFAVSQEAINDGLLKLNIMLSQWNKKRWVVYAIQELSVAATGAQRYTVGPGGQLNIAVRPSKIMYAFLRQTISSSVNPVDYPLGIINSKEDYSRIRLKSLVSWPEALWYDPQYPLGFAYPWPLIPAPFYLYMGALVPLTRYSSVNVPVGLPEEYEGAIYYNLVIRYGAQYRIQQDPTMVALAKDGLNVLRGANNAISSLRMPAALINTGTRYNIYSDN